MRGKRKTGEGQWGKVVASTLPLVLLVSLVVALQGQATAQDTYEELIPFNHQKHIAAGTPCLFCHPNALNGPVAGIPSVQKCAGCHQSVQVRTEAGQAQVDTLLQAWAAGEPLLWRKTVDIPDFVYFAHRPHIAAGKNCEDCHGNVSEMAVLRVAKRLNMGFCLQNCHRHQDLEKRERLMACVTCHQ